jgi:hypothetical protein
LWERLGISKNEEEKTQGYYSLNMLQVALAYGISRGGMAKI